MSVLLFSTAAFLAVLALLAWQLRAGTGSTATRHQIVLRRIYRTTVIETVPGAGSGTSVSQSVSSSGATSSAPAPTTSSSHS